MSEITNSVHIPAEATQVSTTTPTKGEAKISSLEEGHDRLASFAKELASMSSADQRVSRSIAQLKSRVQALQFGGLRTGAASLSGKTEQLAKDISDLRAKVMDLGTEDNAFAAKQLDASLLEAKVRSSQGAKASEGPSPKALAPRKELVQTEKRYMDQLSSLNSGRAGKTDFARMREAGAKSVPLSEAESKAIDAVEKASKRIAEIHADIGLAEADGADIDALAAASDRLEGHLDELSTLYAQVTAHIAPMNSAAGKCRARGVRLGTEFENDVGAIAQRSMRPVMTLQECVKRAPEGQEKEALQKMQGQWAKLPEMANSKMESAREVPQGKIKDLSDANNKIRSLLLASDEARIGKRLDQEFSSPSDRALLQEAAANFKPDNAKKEANLAILNRLLGGAPAEPKAPTRLASTDLKQAMQAALQARISSDKGEMRMRAKDAMSTAVSIRTALNEERIDQHSSEEIAKLLDPAAEKLALLQGLPSKSPNMTKALMRLEQQVGKLQDAFNIRRGAELSKDTISRFTSAFGDTMFREYEASPNQALTHTFQEIADFHQRSGDTDSARQAESLRDLSTEVAKQREVLCGILGRDCYSSEPTGAKPPRPASRDASAVATQRQALRNLLSQAKILSNATSPGSLNSTAALYMETNIGRLMKDLDIIAPES